MLTEQISEILSEILDMDTDEISPEKYIIRDLDAESIDLLELAVTLNDRFKTTVSEDDIFLRALRMYVNEAREKGADPASWLMEKYPFLPKERIAGILDEMHGGPVLKVGDIINYIKYYGNGKK